MRQQEAPWPLRVEVRSVLPLGMLARTGTAAVVLADGRRGTAAALGSLLSPAPSAPH